MNPRRAPARSPLLSAPERIAYGDLPIPTPHTAHELAALLRLLTDHRHPRLHSIAIGHSRDDASRAAAAAFADAWHATDGAILTVVDWPEQAASWLRPAHNLTAQEPDALVIAAAPLGWTQLARRLRHSTPWRPNRTFGFASLAEPAVAALAGTGVLDGVRGASADGGTWRIDHGGCRINHNPQLPWSFLTHTGPA
ncbi:hypothetical protein [Streptomyces sp. NPDC057545]|uniref:hypothetical protein n=1 Tax=Streptomyces sp. NPDC057545 TaxID=3346164 RepID=UPI0036C02128